MARIYEFLGAGIPASARTILNIGDGVPLHNSFLRRLVARADECGNSPHIVSIDVGRDIFRLQREAIGRLAASSCTFAFHRQDARATFFRDDSFDAAVGSFMIDDCGDPLGLLRELGRVVGPGGTVCVSGHHLAPDVEADDFVHNYSDIHTEAVAVVGVIDLAARASLEVVDRLETPHAWGLVLRV
jgi:ubiquinone/menaquinone biosynthesis C-methylase UbiE